MNDTPGWAPPGSSPSDEPDHGSQQPNEPVDHPVPKRPARAAWAQQQPPAGRWTAPDGGISTPPPPPHPAGPANGGGWGAGWRQPPPAPRPGVIPLRPLGVSEILDGAVATMRAHWRTVLGISLAVSVVTQGLITVVTGLWFRTTSGTGAVDNPDRHTRGGAGRPCDNALGSGSVDLARRRAGHHRHHRPADHGDRPGGPRPPRDHSARPGAGPAAPASAVRPAPAASRPSPRPSSDRGHGAGTAPGSGRCGQRGRRRSPRSELSRRTGSSPSGSWSASASPPPR